MEWKVRLPKSIRIEPKDTIEYSKYMCTVGITHGLNEFALRVQVGDNHGLNICSKGKISKGASTAEEH